MAIKGDIVRYFEVRYPKGFEEKYGFMIPPSPRDGMTVKEVFGMKPERETEEPDEDFLS